jgi:hypothetical protein
MFGNHSSTSVIKNFCDSSLEIRIKTKRRIAVTDFSKFKRSNQEHGLLVCSRDLMEKSSGKGISLYLHDDEIGRQFGIGIDSCYSEIFIDKHPTKLCRYTIGTHIFL